MPNNMATFTKITTHWEYGSFNGKCEKENCKNEVKHRLFDQYGADGIDLKSLCHEHYNRNTQKRTLRRALKKLKSSNVICK